MLIKGGPALLPTPLEDLGRSAMVTALRTQAAASSASAASGEVFSRRDAEDTEDAFIGAESAARATARASKVLQEALSREQRAADGAVSAASMAEAQYARSSGYMQNLGLNVEGVVTKVGMEDRLAPVYKGLQEWKMKVLYSPLRAGRLAGMKAALPYEKAMLTLQGRVGADQQKATALSTQARVMRLNAGKLADDAVLKQAAGQTWRAQSDMAQAHQMVDQAQRMEEEAFRLHAEAQEENEKIPLYVVAARDAAQEAVHRFVPSYAPPPLNKGAFLRPPPTSV